VYALTCDTVRTRTAPARHKEFAMPTTTTLFITLPADEPLAAQVEQRLAPHAEVMRPPPQTLSLEAIELIASIAASGASIAATAVSIAHMKAEMRKTLLEIKQLLIEQGKADQARLSTPAGETRTFAEMDDAFLHQLLGIDE
jgi:hypothetical protein